MYSYDDLFLFAKVAEVGSFLHTAKLLKISHTTISRRVKSLEYNLGVTLLRVNVKHLELTDIGQLIYDSIKNQADNIEQQISTLLSLQKEPQGKLLVQLPIVLAKDLISPHLPEFCRQYPKINLDICYQNNEIDLVKHGFDIAILNHIPRQQNVKIKNIYTSQVQMYCTKRYAQKYGTPQTPEELREHFVIGHLLDDYSTPNNVVITHIITGQESVIEMPKRITSNNSLHNLAMIHSNEVIGTILTNTANEINTDEIIHVLPDYQLLTVKFYLLRHPHGNNIKIQKFCEFLEKCLSQK